MFEDNVTGSFPDRPDQERDELFGDGHWINDHKYVQSSNDGKHPILLIANKKFWVHIRRFAMLARPSGPMQLAPLYSEHYGARYEAIFLVVTAEEQAEERFPAYVDHISCRVADPQNTVVIMTIVGDG